MFVATLACATVACHVAWVGGLNFASLRWLVLLSLPLAGLLVWRWWRAGHAGDTDATSPLTSCVVVLLCVGAAFLALAGHRPDGDDAFYAAMALAPLEYPDVPLRDIVGSYWKSQYGMTSVETLRALFAHTTQAPLLEVFYLWFPACMAMLLVLANYELLRAWNAPLALLGLLATLAVFLLWAETHRTHSNFGLLRLFQGKAVLLSVMVPLLTACAWRAVRNADEPRGRLPAALIASMGLSPTGLVVPLLLVGLIFAAAAFAEPRAHWRKTVLAYVVRMAALAWYPAVVAVIVISPKSGAAVRASGEDSLVVSNAIGDNLALVFGPEPRSLLILASVPLLALCVSPSMRRPVLIWSGLVLLCLFNPWSSAVFRELIADSMAWRLWWALPLPAMAGLVAAAAAVTLGRAGRSVPSGAVGQVLPALVLALVVGGFAALPGTRLVSAANHAGLRWPPEPKLVEKHRMPHRHYRTPLVVLGSRVCSPHSGRCH